MEREFTYWTIGTFAPHLEKAGFTIEKALRIQAEPANGLNSSFQCKPTLVTIQDFSKLFTSSLSFPRLSILLAKGRPPEQLPTLDLQREKEKYILCI